MGSLKDLLIKDLLSMDALISLNSDDAAYNKSYIGDNFALCQRDFNLSLQDLIKLSTNSFLIAFISDTQRSAYLNRLDEYIKSILT